MKQTSIINKVVLFLLISGLLMTGISNHLNANYLIGKYEEQLHTSNQFILNAVRSEFEEDLTSFEVMINTIALFTTKRFSGYPLNSPDMNLEEEFFEGLFSQYILDEQSISDSIYIYFTPEIDNDVHDVWMSKKNKNYIVREIEIPKERYDNNDNMSWFFTPQKAKKAMWVDPYYNRYNKHISSYVSPIYVNDEFIGITGMYLDLDLIKNKLIELSYFEGDMFWIYNRDNEIIYHPLYGEGKPVDQVYSVVDNNRDSDAMVTKINEQEYYSYFSTVNNGWTFVYSIPKDILDDKAQKVGKNVIIVFLVSFVILITFVFVFARKYKKIFSHIIYSLNEVKKGNLAKRITIFSNDEIGLMAKAINESNDNLLRNIKEKNFLAYYNTMTEIPNRNSLSGEITNYFDQMRVDELVIIYVDIDNFRNINELLGYSQGNIFIKKVANILTNYESKDIKLFHTNVDEFVYLIHNHDEDEDISCFTRNILSNFGKNFAFGFHSFHLTVSIGIARYNDKIRTVSDFYRIADIAIYEAKKSGRNKSVFYDETMYDRLIQFNTLERDFERALEKQEFIVHYQPQVTLKTQKTHSVEALVRWEHPEKGLLFPNYFIDYAEKSGLISKLGDLVLKSACEQVVDWINDGMEDIKVAINISKRQIIDNDFVQRSIGIIEEAGLSPLHLEFEITESMLTIDSEDTINKLNQLRDYGITISLDDFGTGYSSFNSLYEFPIQILKIDKGLIDNIIKSNETLIMLESIIDLAHKLNLDVIGEGVEDIEQVKVLESLNCDMIQGFYYSKPLHPDKFVEYYNKERK